MSITFAIEARDYDHEAPFATPSGWWLNVANAHARELLDWLGFAEVHLWESDGLLFAPHVAEACTTRLRLVRGNVDPARETSEHEGHGGCRVIVCPRPEGYLMDRAEQLLQLATEAGNGFLTFG